MRSALLTMMLLAMIASSGCRTAARTVEEPRVDLDIPPGGNRGYLVGTAPAWEGPGKTARKMVEMEIETPPIWKAGQPPQQQPPAASDELTETASTPLEDTPSAAPVPAEEQPPYTK